MNFVVVKKNCECVNKCINPTLLFASVHVVPCMYLKIYDNVCAPKCFSNGWKGDREAVVCRIIYPSCLTLQLIWWCHLRQPCSYILGCKCLLPFRNAYILWICLYASIHWCQIKLVSELLDFTDHLNCNKYSCPTIYFINTHTPTYTQMHIHNERKTEQEMPLTNEVTFIFFNFYFDKSDV